MTRAFTVRQCSGPAARRGIFGGAQLGLLDCQLGESADLVADLAKLFHHGCRHFVHRHHPGEFVGVREKIALERRRRGGEDRR